MHKYCDVMTSQNLIMPTYLPTSRCVSLLDLIRMMPYSWICSFFIANFDREFSLNEKLAVCSPLPTQECVIYDSRDVQLIPYKRLFTL